VTPEQADQLRAVRAHIWDLTGGPARHGLPAGLVETLRDAADEITFVLDAERAFGG